MRTPLSRSLIVVPLLALSTLLGACASGMSAGAADADPFAQEPVTVRVENHNFYDMNVYALVNGQRLRLGTVSGFGTQLFPLRSTMVAGSAQLRLLLDPIGSREGYVTEPILLTASSRVELRVENNLKLTSYSVR
jgi:hypothetical protein